MVNPQNGKMLTPAYHKDQFHASFTTLNNDLVKIQEWNYNWKMSFNSDRNKQGQEVIFSRKTGKKFHPNLYFNDQSTEKSVAYNHLGLTLDEQQLHQW